MNPEKTSDYLPELFWTAAEQNALSLAREREWAEAYSEDHPECPLGRLYLDFLCLELTAG